MLRQDLGKANDEYNAASAALKDAMRYTDQDRIKKARARQTKARNHQKKIEARIAALAAE